MREKFGGGEGTKLDDDFKEMEKVSVDLLRAPFYKRERGEMEEETVIHMNLRIH